MSDGTSQRPQSGGSLDITAINTQWTLRLRFGALFGQLATIAVVYLGMGMEVPLCPLLGLIALGLLSNILALLRVLRGTARLAWLLPALMGFDVLNLTAMLYLTGGPMNPFSFMYLVLIAMATVVLPPRATWGLVALSVAGSAVLFLWHRPLDWHGHSGISPMRIHLYGMWVAFSVAAGFIVYFLLRIRRALAQRELELEAASNLAARRDKLASLATLAAGAAHELSTPLGTIAIAAKELERQLCRAASDAAALEDVQLIRTQVARCRGVLEKLAREAGGSTGESLVESTAAGLLREAQEGLLEGRVVLIRVAPEVASLSMRLPVRSLAQALRALLRNAMDASLPESIVEVEVRAEGKLLRIEISDHGQGMPAEVLRRIGEPFYTTKEPGRGLGLGVFLCRAVIESLSGQLVFSSGLGIGTRAIITLPLQGAVTNWRRTAPLAA
jgi:two-component system sensor histidine kinase RegB